MRVFFLSLTRLIGSTSDPSLGWTTVVPSSLRSQEKNDQAGQNGEQRGGMGQGVAHSFDGAQKAGQP